MAAKLPQIDVPLRPMWAPSIVAALKRPGSKISTSAVVIATHERPGGIHRGSPCSACSAS